MQTETKCYRSLRPGFIRMKATTDNYLSKLDLCRRCTDLIRTSQQDTRRCSLHAVTTSHHLSVGRFLLDISPSGHSPSPKSQNSP